MIKATELLQAVIKLAEKKPDGSARCRYFGSDGNPCCIVGHGMAALGVSGAPFLADDELNAWRSVNELPAEGYLEADSPTAVKVLNDIQMYQDRDHTWGVALEMATANQERRMKVGDYNF